ILSEKFEVTQTFYDDIIPESSPILSSLFPNLGDVAGQQNLRNRISSITFEHYWDKIDTTFDYATHYSYDIAGNVKQLVQDIPELAPVGHRFKRMGYEYDLISGKANYAYYQQDSVDQFIHHYVYDEDNRVEYVETSRDGLLWERDANYEYYLHGPLGRTELGERRVQGLDYAYTLQGWLKGMNASTLSLSSTTSSTLTTRDMGRDGNGGNTGDLTRNKLVGRDVAGYTLGYYYGDYRMVSTTSGDRFEMTYAKNNYIDQSSASLYNGNIRHAMYTVAKLNEKTPYDATVEMYAYKYDQLHRLRSQRAYNSGYSYSSFAWVSGSASTMFQEDVNYDPNGNILSYYRRGNSGTPATVMDNLTYQFGSDNNKLLYIDDAQTNTSAYIGDLEDQSSGNYNYDQNGNLTQDTRDSITAITWTNAQKIDAVAKTDRSIAFKYNPLQQRVAKYSKAIGSDAEKRTYYVRDAQGNVMATYQAWVQNDNGDISWDSFALLEHHIYGTARVGMALPNVKLYPAAPPNPHAADSMHYEIFEGWKRYEIANHLGNVLAVVTDRKRGKASSGQNIQWFVADVVASQQYYPFGMLMPGDASVTLRRQYSLNSTDYRYGFNGKEGDDEIKGDDNQQDYGMRIYDPRVARFLSVDPITAQYPMLTPYQFASNTPIQAIDLDGLEAWQVNNTWNGYYINLFRNEVVSQISNSKSLRKKYTCDDLGLELIVEFSKNHNLPFKWSTGVMEFDAESPEFKDYESFLLSLKMKSGAPDFDNLRNTADIAKDNIQIGSLSVLTHTGKDRPNHIQLISGITISENGSVDNYSVAQGNFRSDFWGGRLQGSNSPKDFNYLGVEIEEGYYIIDIDTWYNNSKNTITENFSKEYKIQYKNYNFELWNKKFLYQQKYKVDTGPSGTMGGGLYWVREGETHRENRNDKEK
ncbi:MAG TPA: RHS repeat-associated core domain-containing protein, partial [Saprospiraceae bacterium]|nr:RHS repeat-associated core domain-containing protein [Saprospiraceae bacterium]